MNEAAVGGTRPGGGFFTGNVAGALSRAFNLPQISGASDLSPTSPLLVLCSQ